MNRKYKLRDAIRAIVEAEGWVMFPYKKSIKSWYDESKIGIIRLTENREGRVVVAGVTNRKFTDLDDAVDFYCHLTFSKRNIGLAYDGIRKHRLTEKSLDCMEDDELTSLVKWYMEDYFAEDYLA